MYQPTMSSANMVVGDIISGRCVNLVEGDIKKPNRTKSNQCHICEQAPKGSHDSLLKLFLVVVVINDLIIVIVVIIVDQLESKFKKENE